MESAAVRSGVEVLHLADAAAQFRKQPGVRLGVVPDVRAGAGATGDALEGIEAPVRPPLARAGRERRDGRHQAIEQPVGQRGVVVGVSPEARLAGQPIVLLEQVVDHGLGVCETVSRSSDRARHWENASSMRM